LKIIKITIIIIIIIIIMDYYLGIMILKVRVIIPMKLIFVLQEHMDKLLFINKGFIMFLFPIIFNKVVLVLLLIVWLLM